MNEAFADELWSCYAGGAALKLHKISQRSVLGAGCCWLPPSGLGPWAGMLWGGRQVCVGQAYTRSGTLGAQQIPGQSLRAGFEKNHSLIYFKAGRGGFDHLV